MNTMHRSRSHFPVFSLPPQPPLSKQFANTSRNLLSFAFPLSAYAAIPNPTPYRRVSVRGDGRCLYRAIAKNIAHTEGRFLSENLEREDADALRNIAWKSICVDRAKEFIARHIIEGSLTQYCSQMRNPTFYAGEPELLALSDFLKLPIMIYLEVHRGQLKNIATYGEKYKSKTSTKPRRDKVVRLLYVNGNHYDALLLTQ